MQQNLKVDIIYYSTPTDFELEFNLCGCCGIRLLTDKVSDKKALISSLMRAVGRSQIIIAVGKLFDDNGLITVVSKAIGKGTEAVSNSSYGIRSDDKISIINGSIPLVSKDGLFGGCIIESGPQTIILLSDNRSIRKNILNTLIHPYVVEFNAIILSRNMNRPSENPQVIPDLEIEHGETIPEEQPAEEMTEKISEDEIREESGEEADDENPIADIDDTELIAADTDNILSEDVTSDSEPDGSSEITEDNDNAPPDNNTDFDIWEDTDPSENISIPVSEHFDFVFQPQKFSRSKQNEYAKNYIPSDSDKMFYTGESKGGNKLNIWILILVIICIVSVAVLMYFAVYLPMQNGSSMVQYIKEIFDVFV